VKKIPFVLMARRVGQKRYSRKQTKKKENEDRKTEQNS